MGGTWRPRGAVAKGTPCWQVTWFTIWGAALQSVPKAILGPLRYFPLFASLSGYYSAQALVIHHADQRHQSLGLCCIQHGVYSIHAYTAKLVWQGMVQMVVTNGLTTDYLAHQSCSNEHAPRALLFPYNLDFLSSSLFLCTRILLRHMSASQVLRCAGCMVTYTGLCLPMYFCLSSFAFETVPSAFCCRPDWEGCKALAAAVVNASQPCPSGNACALGVAQPVASQKMYALTGEFGVITVYVTMLHDWHLLSEDRMYCHNASSRLL